MAWTIAPISKNIQKGLDSLMKAEHRKYTEWIDRITTNNEDPSNAAQNLGYSVRKLQGVADQWELYVGSRSRVSYAYNLSTQLVEIVGVGHT